MRQGAELDPFGAGQGTAASVGLAALVTGGGSGIGLGAATRLVRDGAHVTICGRTEDRLRSAVAALEGRWRPRLGAAGSTAGTGAATYVVADVTVEEQVARAVEVARRNGVASTSCSPTPGGPCTWARSLGPIWTRCGRRSIST